MKTRLIYPPEIAVQMPEQDRWALDPRTRRIRIEEEVVRRHRLSGFLLQPENEVARAEFETKCKNSFEYFLRNCVWTKDPERRVIGVVDLPLIMELSIFNARPLSPQTKVVNNFLTSCKLIPRCLAK